MGIFSLLFTKNQTDFIDSWRNSYLDGTGETMTELSEATWTVIAAYGDAPFSGRPAIAAALRAAAEYCKQDRLILLSIANELENS